MNRRQFVQLFGSAVVLARSMNLPADTPVFEPAAKPDDPMPTRLEPERAETLTGLELVRLHARCPSAMQSAWYELTLTRGLQTNGPYLNRPVFQDEGLLCTWQNNVLLPFDWLPPPEQRIQGMLSVYCSNPDVNWMAMFRHDRGLKVLAGGPGA